MDYHKFIQDAIKRDKPNEGLKKAVEDAKFQRNLYTGKNLDDIITDYRTRESENQKKQRTRIAIGRSKNLIRQIENVFNYLSMLDNPNPDIIHKNEDVRKKLMSWVYNNNIVDYAFKTVKTYGGLIDANAYLVCGTNDEGELEFKVMKAANLYDIVHTNGLSSGVMFVTKRKVDNEEVSDYSLYHDQGIIIYKDRKGQPLSELEKYDRFYIEEIPTTMKLCFNLGFLNDELNEMPTKLTTIEASSELFRALLQLGADADVVKATHGIIKQFSYTRKCNYRNRSLENFVECRNGTIYKDNEPTTSVCPNCHGTGLDIHTSSQDVITFPFPDDPTNIPPLSNLTHVVPVPDGILEFNRQDIKDIRDEILHTTFNSSVITKDNINQTATGEMVDLQGVYATLSVLGKHVSECFIWMVECKCMFEGITEAGILHGYTLSLKLESVETLSAKRKTLIDANAPMEVIRALDLAIVQKQHYDSPAYINRFTIWEQYRPFADKSPQDIQAILAGLPQTNFYKILSNFWGMIKREIEAKHGDKFFDAGDDARKKMISTEVEIIKNELMKDLPLRTQFEFNNIE